MSSDPGSAYELFSGSGLQTTLYILAGLSLLVSYWVLRYWGNFNLYIVQIYVKDLKKKILTRVLMCMKDVLVSVLLAVYCEYLPTILNCYCLFL